MAKVQRQAGDQYVDFVLAELDKARTRLPRISRAADLAADRIISHHGGLLAAGDDGVGGESVWRAGSIAFFKRYLPEANVPSAGSEGESQQPSCRAVYRTPLLHVRSLDELPKHDNHLYIDLKFAQYDTCLKIPGYPFPAIPTSWLSDSLVYWHLVADTVELLARK